LHRQTQSVPLCPSEPLINVWRFEC